MGRWARLRRSKVFWGLSAVVVILVMVRVALPHVVLHYVNRTLAQLDGYRGRVEGVNLRLWRGAYQIEGVRIDKVENGPPVPFFRAERVDLSVAWDALFRGNVVAEVELHSPELNFVEDPEQEQTEAASNWEETVQELVPFRIERFAVYDGRIHYRQFQSDPEIDIYLQDIRASVRNITNSEDLGESLFAQFDAEGLAMGSGSLRLDGRINPYADDPTFELRGQLTELDITELNDFLEAYAKVDAEEGTFSIDTELTASEGEFSGYIKPFIADLRVLDWGDEDKGFFRKVWEGVVEVTTDILEDSPRDTIATRVPVSGQVEEPDADIWATIGGLLRNAFIESLRRGLEGKVDGNNDNFKSDDD